LKVVLNVTATNLRAIKKVTVPTETKLALIDFSHAFTSFKHTGGMGERAE
jgi:hypothetical protein